MERAFQGFGESGYLGCVRCLLENPAMLNTISVTIIEGTVV